MEQQATWRRLYRFAYARLGNRQEAEDLTQETFTRTLALPDPSQDLVSRARVTVSVDLAEAEPIQRLVDDYTSAHYNGYPVQVAAAFVIEHGPISRFYVKRVVRQDATGAWFLVGYDLR